MSSYKILNQRFSLPDNWDELTRAQLAKIAPYLFAQKDDWPVRLKLLLALAPVLNHKRLRQLGQSDSEYLVRQLDWLYDTHMERCPLESFYHAGQKFYLPEPVFNNLVGIEYVSADHQFRQFARDKPTPGALDALLATICRPAKLHLNVNDPEWDGDVREKFNSKIAEARALDFKDLPLPTKMVVLRYFIGSQRAFHARYQELYTRPEGGGQGRSNAFGMLGTLDSLAGEGVFGTFEQVCFTNVHTLFFHLLKAKRDARQVPAEG